MSAAEVIEIWKKPEPTIIYKSDLFQLINADGVILIDANIASGSERFVRDLKDALYRTHGYELTDRYRLRYPLDMLVPIIDDIKTARAESYKETSGDCIDHLLMILKKIESDETEAREQRIANGEIAFKDISKYLENPENKNVYGTHTGQQIGGVLIETEMVPGSFFRSPGVSCTVEVLTLYKNLVVKGTIELFINQFDGNRKIADLEVRKLTDDVKEALSQRGAKFIHHIASERYVHLTGTIKQASYIGVREFRATGRFMIDSQSFQDSDPDAFRNQRRVMPAVDDSEDKVLIGHEQQVIDLEDYWMCFPRLLGFSLAAKQWGFVGVDDIRSIAWRDDAFDKLVLDPSKKNLVKSLVEFHGSSFEDVIDGKGGGCIFLLHGEPGQGKTLTAEAVAELLHRPLYSISVGELGTNPNQLEDNLRQILDTAVTWNAVLLLDEADIFLEARDEKDIMRNAMVGIFLRLLEYHQGVMFLTTNRVKNIDKAFYSRISVALRFPSSDFGKRLIIWRNLLESAKVVGMTDVNISDMARMELNGRQIKNAIRNAQTLALSEGIQINKDHLLRTITVALDFEKEMAIV